MPFFKMLLVTVVRRIEMAKCIPDLSCEPPLLLPVAAHGDLLHAVVEALLLHEEPDFLTVRTPRVVVAEERHFVFTTCGAAP